MENFTDWENLTAETLKISELIGILNNILDSEGDLNVFLPQASDNILESGESFARNWDTMIGFIEIREVNKEKHLCIF